MGFGFLLPVAKFVLRTVIGEVLSAEKLFGAGKGPEKLEEATGNIKELLSAKFSLENVLGAIDEVVELVESVVDLGNALGLLDDEPGLDVDYTALVAAFKRTFLAVSALADALS